MAQRGRRPKPAGKRTGTGTQAMAAKDRDPRHLAGRNGTRRHAEDGPGGRGGSRGRARSRKDGGGPREAPRRGPAGAGRTLFDGFAEGVTRIVSSAYFFAFCIAMVVAWALFGPATGYSDTWQLVINTGTTIMTFLMVAVLQNSSRRGERAIQAKLDAIADALADFMDKADIELEKDVEELQEAVGLEERVGSR